MRAYSGQKSPARGDREDELITELLPMVHRIAGQVVSYLRSLLSFEDMVSARTVRFVRAARGFEPSHRAEFQIYTYIKIIRALDELRAWSFIPEIENERIRDAQQLSQKIMQETGAIPNDTRLTKRLGVTIDELDETFEDARAQHFVSLDGFGDDSPALGNLLVANQTRSPVKRLSEQSL
jgi:DNA-directed RNA polymerase specialized sigma subunit